jgi:hypothetical protein
MTTSNTDFGEYIFLCNDYRNMYLVYYYCSWMSRVYHSGTSVVNGGLVDSDKNKGSAQQRG